MRQYLEIIHNLNKIAGKTRKLNLVMFFSSAAYNLASLLPPVATAGIVRLVTEGKYEGIPALAVGYIVAYLVYFLFMRVNLRAYTRLAEIYHIGMQKKIFEAVEGEPEILEKTPRGRVMDTFADDIRWLVDARDCWTEALIQILRLVVIFGIFIKYDLLVATIAIGVDLLYLILLNRNAAREAKAYDGARKMEDAAISAFGEMIEGVYEGATEKEKLAGKMREKMNRSFGGWRKVYREKRRAIVNRNTHWAMIPYVGKILLYMLLGKFVIEGEMGIDLLVLLIGYFELTITTMDKLQDRLLNLSNYGVRVQRIEKLVGK